MMMGMVGMFAGGGRGGGQKKAEMNEDRKDYLRYLGQTTVGPVRSRCRVVGPGPCPPVQVELAHARRRDLTVQTPVVLLAALGGLSLRREDLRTPLGCVLFAWAVVWVGATAATVMTRVGPEFERYAVEFLGRVAPDDVPALLARASAVVLSSRREGLPTAAIAASMAGRPIVVISYNHCGAGEDVERDIAPLLAGPKPASVTATKEQYLEVQRSSDLTLAWGSRSAILGGYVPDVSPSQLDAFVAQVEHIPGDASISVTVMGGAIGRMPDEAMAFINFLLEPQMAALITSKLKYASASEEARLFVPKEIAQNPDIYPPASVVPRLEWIKDVGESIKLYDRAWTELKVK